MAAIEFQCPRCSTVLRARDHSFAGREIACPDCRTPLLIEAELNGRLFAREVSSSLLRPAGSSGKAPRETPVAPPAPSPMEASAPSGPMFLKRETLWDRIKTPTGGLILAVTLAISAVLLAILIDWLRGPDREPSSVPAPREVADDNAADRKDEPAATAESIAERLRPIGEQMNQARDRNLAFPTQISEPALLPAESLSWIAVLLEQQQPAAQPPLWDRPWNDPLNADFSKQPLPGFLNPTIAQTTTPDGFPVTHFVGIAGVGADARNLPVDSPKAGIFGTRRVVTLDDIPDGLSQTWMLAGVRTQLGPWAAGETPTMRELTQAPYINGPDGFGTGEADGMTILMADGSVRTLKGDVDPSVLERLATIADGFPRSEPPLPPPAEAEPNSEVPMPPQLVQQPAENPPLMAPKPAMSVVDNLLAQLQQLPPPPKPEPIDIEARLSQQVNSYRQSKETRLSLLLEEFEEMVGVPFNFDELADPAEQRRLERTIRVSLTAPTLRQILEELLKPAGLTFRLGENRIDIVPALP